MYIARIKSIDVECNSCNTTVNFECTDEHVLRQLADTIIRCPLCNNELNNAVGHTAEMIYKYNNLCKELSTFTRTNSIELRD